MEKEIIFRPNVALPNHKHRRHNHNHPINVFQRVNYFTSPVILSRKKVFNKAEGDRAFNTVCCPYNQFCASLGAAGALNAFGGKRRREVWVSAAGRWIAAESLVHGPSYKASNLLSFMKDSKLTHPDTSTLHLSAGGQLPFVPTVQRRHRRPPRPGDSPGTMPRNPRACPATHPRPRTCPRPAPTLMPCCWVVRVNLDSFRSKTSQ